MSWINVLTAFVSAFIGAGGLGLVLYRKENRGVKQSDAIKNLLSAISGMSEGFKNNQLKNNEYVKSLMEQIHSQNKSLADNLTAFNALKHELQACNLKLATLERKNRGLELRTLELEEKLGFSERHICLDVDCDFRKPKLGEFKSSKM